MKVRRRINYIHSSSYCAVWASVASRTSYRDWEVSLVPFSQNCLAISIVVCIETQRPPFPHGPVSFCECQHFLTYWLRRLLQQQHVNVSWIVWPCRLCIASVISQVVCRDCISFSWHRMGARVLRDWSSGICTFVNSIGTVPTHLLCSMDVSSFAHWQQLISYRMVFVVFERSLTALATCFQNRLAACLSSSWKELTEYVREWQLSAAHDNTDPYRK